MIAKGRRVRVTPSENHRKIIIGPPYTPFAKEGVVDRFMEQEGSGYGLEANQAVFQIQHPAWLILGWMVANIVAGRHGPMCVFRSGTMSTTRIICNGSAIAADPFHVTRER